MAAWAMMMERGYEGLVAKDEASCYEGGTTRRWLKVKRDGWAGCRWKARSGTQPGAMRTILDYAPARMPPSEVTAGARNLVA